VWLLRLRTGFYAYGHAGFIAGAEVSGSHPGRFPLMQPASLWNSALLVWNSPLSTLGFQINVKKRRSELGTNLVVSKERDARDY
jgi:hypothetical protein